MWTPHGDRPAPSPDRLFASVELARRIERAEVGLLAGCAAAALGGPRGAGVRSLELGGGIAVWMGEELPFNKVAGLGFGGPPEEMAVAAVEAIHREHGAPVRVELSSLAEPGIAEAFSDRGYRLVGFENVLGLALPLAAPLPVAPEVEVRASPDRELGLWMDLLVDGFAHPDAAGVPSDEEFPRAALEEAFRVMATIPGFRRYLARRDGKPAGGASQRISDGVAQLCGAATISAHRRRGVQSSLLAVRLAEATAAGCDVAIVTTQPGSTSQKNVQRLGFDLLYTRAILVRPVRVT